MRSTDIDLRATHALVPLTKGYKAVVDLDDVYIVAPYTWCAARSGNLVYAISDQSSRGGKAIRMHRVIIGAPKGIEVDHIDGDSLNNRKSNLRLATRAQNAKNCRRPINNKSGYKGVYFHKASGKWLAQISANGKRVYIGCFDAPELAHAAYLRAAEKLHGEFARVGAEAEVALLAEKMAQLDRLEKEIAATEALFGPDDSAVVQVKALVEAAKAVLND